MYSKFCRLIGFSFVLMSSVVWAQGPQSVLNDGFAEAESMAWEADSSSNAPADPWDLVFEPSILHVDESALVADAKTIYSEGNWTASQNDRSNDRWQFEISPYVWATGIKGFLGVNDRGSSYDLEISDTLNLMDEVEIMAFGSLKAKKNRTSFFVDFIYTKMDHITTGDLGLQLPAIARGDLDLEWEELFLQFGTGYTICEWTTPAGRRTSLDLQGGGRYLYISGNDEIIGGPNDRILIGIDGSENFIEPWIGAMLEAELSPCTTLVLGGDIGGFGHGETPDTNWQYYVKVRYHVTPQLSLDAGYRHLNVEYEDSLGGRDFHFEQEVYGPTVGLTFQF